MVERLFLTVPRGCLQFVIVVFSDHTHLLFLGYRGVNPMTLKVDIDLESADPVHGYPGSAHCLTERDIWVKLPINRSKGSEDIERAQNY